MTWIFSRKLLNIIYIYIGSVLSFLLCLPLVINFLQAVSENGSCHPDLSICFRAFSSTFLFTFPKLWASFCPFLITKTWLYLHLSLQPVHRFAHYTCLPYHLKRLSYDYRLLSKMLPLVIAVYILWIKMCRHEDPKATERVPIKYRRYALALMHQFKIIEVKLKFQDYLYALVTRNWEQSVK